MVRIMIARGEGALKDIWDRGYRSDILLTVGPVSKAFLLYEDMFKKIYESCGYSLVIPSSYDDAAIYVNMRRLGYRICRGSGGYDGIEIHCLERGERPWARMLLRRVSLLTLFFTEDLDPIDLEDPGAQIPSSARGDLVFISYGVLQPSGVILSRWVSLRINPFEDLIAFIETSNRSLALDLMTHGYRLSLQLRLDHNQGKDHSPG